ncbi:MAG: GNAT family N-acetyltransferase [Burkholderiales bacterium]
MFHPTITEPLPGEAPEIRSLMAAVIERDVTRDEALLSDTLANVNSNMDFWLENPDRCVHLVARLAGRTVGVVLVKDFWNLCSLFVASDAQGTGIGRALVQEAAARCSGRSPKNALYLIAAADAIAFYRKLGFIERTAAGPLPPGFLAMQRPV